MSKHIHLIGICGTAMASLAGMLKAREFRVTGSDNAVYPPMSDFLARLGIAVAQPFDAKNLEPRPDLVVVGNAISRGNAELERVLDERIPLTSMAALLREQFLRGSETIAVAGTHGKTTTTSMLAWIFETAHRKPSFLVGGIAENFGGSFQLGSGEFIIEADEYDTAFFDKGPKFLHYFPDAVILTSVEFDHADIYRDLEAVKTAFKRLVNLAPRRGVIVAWDGESSTNNPTLRQNQPEGWATQKSNLDECVARAFCRVERYGFGENSQWRIADLRQEPERSSWTLLRSGKAWGNFEFAIAGEYNVLNASAAAAMAAQYGIKPAQIAEALRTFKSVKRRLEVRAEVNGVTIVDDFAHHPTAIAQTLGALRTRYPGRRMWAVLEPRSNTLRRRVLQKELVEALAQADAVVVAAIFKSEAIPENERLDVQAVVHDIEQRGRPAWHLADADAIVKKIVPELKAGDVVAVLSNGGFGGIHEKLAGELKRRS
ncbi:MAG: UDP-N-acetylmuramate:L-alanyl-gamma-D-glutamyl-meso-diaminopimelate ligase [Terriglobales bacterium]